VKSPKGPHGAAITGGRANNNDIVIPDFTISNTHFHFRYEGTKIVLVDLGSTNGTHLNGERLQKDRRVVLANQAKLVFGRYQLEFFTAPGFCTMIAELAGVPLEAVSLR
jgi:pSer/pThr/pTyr-binding forkhead associated (FHA) protein